MYDIILSVKIPLNLGKYPTKNILLPQTYCYPDKLKNFTGRTTLSLDSRLSILDWKVGSLESSLKDLVLSAHVWNSIQHNIQAWNSQLKVDRMTSLKNTMLEDEGNQGIP